MVAREYKWEDPTRQDLFSVSTASDQIRLLAALAMGEQRSQLWTIDVKDAFLQVPQKSIKCLSTHLEGTNICWKEMKFGF